MSFCISSRQSEKFIDFLQRKGANIYSTPFIIKFAINKRNNVGYARKIYKYIMSQDDDDFPVYVLLNLVFTEYDDKHSMLMIVEKNDDTYNLYLYDSNGRITRTTRRGDIYIMESNVLDIADELKKMFGSATITDLSPLKYSNMNLIGTGHCDSIALWVLNLFYHSRDLESGMKKLEKLRERIRATPKPVTMEINRKIVALESR